VVFANAANCAGSLGAQVSSAHPGVLLAHGGEVSSTANGRMFRATSAATNASIAPQSKLSAD